VKTLLLSFWILVLPALASAVEFSTAEIAGKRITVCRVNITNERVQLFHLDETGQPFKRFERLATWLEPRGQKLVFAMNAGMFRPDFSPVGLFATGGQEVVSLNSATGDGNFFLKPNGVFAITTGGARVVETSEYPQIRERVILATQSGPLLVRAGRIHPAFNAKSESRHIRNGVGVPSPDVAIFAISEAPVTFHEFATLFRDKLHCPDALFLDGAISKLYSPRLKRSDSRTDFGPIIAVTE
jgi:uncharacterized protein YigE (DUF2233 family)